MTEHFSEREARCRCDPCRRRQLPLPPDVQRTARRLEKLRELVGGRPLKVSSWFRCREHPAETGKRPGSLHRHSTGRAVDIHCQGELRWRIMEQARKAGFLNCGHYRWGLHLDWVRDAPPHWTG